MSRTAAGTVAAAVYGVAYNMNDPTTPERINSGVNAVFLVAAAVSLIGLLLVIFVVRPQMAKKAASQ